MAPVGVSENVNGSNKAIVVTGPKPGQHTDQRAEQHTREAGEQMFGRERRRKPKRKVIERHCLRSAGRARTADPEVR